MLYCCMWLWSAPPMCLELSCWSHQLQQEWWCAWVQHTFLLCINFLTHCPILHCVTHHLILHPLIFHSLCSFSSDWAAQIMLSAICHIFEWSLCYIQVRKLIHTLGSKINWLFGALVSALVPVRWSRQDTGYIQTLKCPPLLLLSENLHPTCVYALRKPTSLLFMLSKNLHPAHNTARCILLH